MSIGERHLFSWLHVSDLHFGHGGRSYGWDQETVLDLLCADVKEALKKWPELPSSLQAVIVTGDIAYSGAVKGHDEYDQARSWFNKLIEVLRIGAENVFMVPGNHDVQRGVAPDPVEKARARPETLDDILGETDSRDELLKRQSNYKKFAENFGSRELDAWEHSFPVDGLHEDRSGLRLVGLNTALLCNDDSDKGQLHLAGRQRKMLTTNGADVNLLLTHHPFQDGWMHKEGDLQHIAEGHVNIHLCGHTHEPQVSVISSAGRGVHVRLVAAAAHRSKSEKASHGYNLASLLLAPDGRLKLRVWPRRWYPKWKEFRVDSDSVPDRRFFDDKDLGVERIGSGLVLESPEEAKFHGVHWWGKPAVRWDELLYGKEKLDVFGISVRTLFDGSNIGHVENLLEKGGTVRVLLGDLRSRFSMARYDEDFGKPLGDRSRKLYEVITKLWELKESLDSPAKNRLEIWLTRYTFKYSAYRIDGDAIVVPYAMLPGKRTLDTPGLVFSEDSPILERFFRPDLDGLLADAEELTADIYREIKKVVGA